MIERLAYTDSIYGPLSYDADMTALVQSPVLQRLRHIRLSNIDSVNMPGIASLSRYEHALGVGYLASQIASYRSLSRINQLSLVAAALLHDWAITSYGHLVEEAFHYTRNEFDHEHKLAELIIGEDSSEIGGVERQLIFGRQMNLRSWAQSAIGARDADELLHKIMRYIEGDGEFGRLISGDIDLDNVDGVFRMAIHMGLSVDRDWPVCIARSIVGTTPGTGAPVFHRTARQALGEWVSAREKVYERLMLADDDFVGKLMLLYATIGAIESAEIQAVDWNLTDSQLLHRLQTSSNSRVSETVTRWLVGEPWHKTPLYWMKGLRPEFPDILDFSRTLSLHLSRNCFVYGIKDKRHRALTVHYDNGAFEPMGKESIQWLLGAGATERRPFRATEVRSFLDLAETTFATEVISEALSPWAELRAGDLSGCLL